MAGGIGVMGTPSIIYLGATVNCKFINIKRHFSLLILN